MSPYHQNLHDSLRRLQLPEGDQALRQALSAVGWQGTRRVVYHDAARTAAEATGAFGLMDFELTRSLASVYDQQDRATTTQQARSASVFNPAVLDPANVGPTLRSLATYFEMIVQSERNLIWSYDAVLEQLGSDARPVADSLFAEEEPAR